MYGAAGASGLHGAAKDLATIASRSPARSNSKDGDLVATMAARLSKLEAMNAALKKELAEKNAKIAHLEDKNEQLTMAASDDSIH